MIELETQLEKIPRVGKKYGEILKKLNLKTVQDFLWHFPFRYEDYSQRILIDDLTLGENVTVMGSVLESKLVRTWKKRMLITECLIGDETGTVRAVWFNQPYVSDSLLKGKGVRLSGKVSQDKSGLFFSNPAWELSSRTPTNTGRLVPVYPETEGLTSRWIRWQLQNIFKLEISIPDPIPLEILQELHLPNITTALKYIHFPKNENEYLLAQKRFAFQTMLTVQLTSLNIKKAWEKEKAVGMDFAQQKIEEFKKTLSFELTGAQQKAVAEICDDLSKSIPMNRLLNGDVGSGKTIVAALASLNVALNGYQVAIMAPTEVLAKQHYESFCKIFKNYDFKIGLATGSAKLVNYETATISEDRPQIIRGRSSSNKLDSKFITQNSNIVIGTHALIQKDVRFKKLSLVIVDEQHRFGVSQRAYLQKEIEKINDGLPGKIPHLLSMTATPIPRTLTLAFFGNLDLSVLDEMPKNRLPIVTKIVSKLQRAEAYEFVREQIKAGRQAFVILPLVEESKVLTELKAATAEHKRLSAEIFPNLSLGLLHGKLKPQEKEIVMEAFRQKKYEILVATSVVEVGIDIPNATVIIIEDAERFGLAQLHQFRGRVGRGQHQSYCLLFTSKSNEKVRARLGALVKNSDGFSIAEKDLEFRGPGEFFGSRQSGIPDVAMAHLGNVKLIEIAKKYAFEILTKDPQLKNHPLLKKEIDRFSDNTHLE